MSRRCPLLLTVLLALALLARVVVPSGWMPAERGGLAFVPCPAAGPVGAKPMHHGREHEQAGHGQAAGDCAFAPLLAAGALASPIDILITPPVAVAPAPASSLSPLRAGAAHGLPPATGPPALA